MSDAKLAFGYGMGRGILCNYRVKLCKIEGMSNYREYGLRALLYLEVPEYGLLMLVWNSEIH